jgi:hypothetical protein
MRETLVQPRARQRRRVGRVAHLVDVELPLHERDNLPVLTVKFRRPSHEFTFGVGMTFVSYPLVLTLVV